MMVTGRREQKREQTRQRLLDEGRRLFAEQGFDGTSVDEIAAAAGVSRRTFFHYFEAKGDIVLSRHEDFERVLVEEISRASPGLPLLEVAERAMLAALDSFDAAEVELLERLKAETSALRSRDHAKYERIERAIADALAERYGTTADDMRNRMEAMLLTGMLRVGGEGWSHAAAAGIPLREFVQQLVRSVGPF